MKNIFFAIAILFSAGCFAQDSANIRISGVILKGRESDIVCFIVKSNTSDFPILDSVIKAIYVTKPANGDNVTFNSIPNKEWVRMFKKVSNNATAVLKNAYANIITELQLHGGTFISHRIDVFNTGVDDDFVDIKKQGQNYAQKKSDGDTF